MDKEQFNYIYKNYDRLRKVDTSTKIMSDVTLKVAEKIGITPRELMDALEIISYTKFNMKYYG